MDGKWEKWKLFETKYSDITSGNKKDKYSKAEVHLNAATGR